MNREHPSHAANGCIGRLRLPVTSCYFTDSGHHMGCFPAFPAILEVLFHHFDFTFRHYFSRKVGPLRDRKVLLFISPRLHFPASSLNFTATAVPPPPTIKGIEEAKKYRPQGKSLDSSGASESSSKSMS